MSKSLTVTIPIRLASPLNGSHGNWRGPAFRRRAQRDMTLVCLGGHTLPALPVVVTITRLGPRKLDSDNLAASAKSVRDEIAKQFGVDDGDEDAYVWRYAQEKSKEYGVRVEIESAKHT